MPHLRKADTGTPWVDGGPRRAAPLLGEASGGHAPEQQGDEVSEQACSSPDVGELVIVLLAGTLASLRDRLAADGFESPADLVADLVELTHDYLGRPRN